MTVSYTGGLSKQLFRWKGSVWKALWPELLIFLVIYYTIWFCYLFAMDEGKQRVMEHVVTSVSNDIQLIPLQFLLGFFINQIRKRFPTTNHLVKTGLMTDEERKLYDSYTTPYDKWWIPTLWILGQLRECQEKGAFPPSIYRYLVLEVETWRAKFQKMLQYDWISFPLVYTQVVTVATYGYMCLCLVGRQMLLPSDLIGFNAPIFFPFPTILQFIFYMGWLKVGEALLDPFGEDDEDFELNWILDRNLYVGYMMVDFVSDQLPAPCESDVVPTARAPKIPHTKASAKIRETGAVSHLSNVKILEKEMELVFDMAGPRKRSPQVAVSVPNQEILP